MSEAWVSYAEQQPAAGVYEWRMPSVAVPGISVIVLSAMRTRGSGWGNPVLSPDFDYWDGYRLHVPDGLEWRETPVEKIERCTVLVGVDGLEFDECPFCEKKPALKAVETYDRATVVNGKPHRLNSWWLSCCRWGDSPHLADPRELHRIRSEAFARIVDKAAKLAAQ